MIAGLYGKYGRHSQYYVECVGAETVWRGPYDDVREARSTRDFWNAIPGIRATVHHATADIRAKVKAWEEMKK